MEQCISSLLRSMPNVIIRLPSLWFKLCSSIYRCELHNKELKINDVMTMTQLCACPSHFNLEESISYLPLPGDDDGHGGLFLVHE